MSFHISEFIYIFYYPTSDNENMMTWALKGSSERRERGGRVEDNIIFHALHLDVRDTWS